MAPRPSIHSLARQLAKPSTRNFSTSPAWRYRPFKLEQLAPKAELQVSAMGRFAKLVPPRKGKEVVQRVGSTYGGTHELGWLSPPKNVLLVMKWKDAKALAAARRMIEYISQARPELAIVVEMEVYDDLRHSSSATLIPLRRDDMTLLGERIDFVIALGGDGTLLRVSSLFDVGAVPPVLGVSMGSLGFLMPTHIENFPTMLEEVLESRASMLLRMRLQCRVINSLDGSSSAATSDDTETVHAMNEITLHRGASPHLIYLDAHVNGEFLTEVVADGCLLSTPTGSTAYSLSAGGPIVHPSVQSLLLTAISPRSLSFRTVLLPSDVTVQLSLSSRSRSPQGIQLSLDGQSARTLLPTQSLEVSMSPFPVPCIAGEPTPKDGDTGRNITGTAKQVREGGAGRGNDGGWVGDIRRMLRFNAPFQEGRPEDELHPTHPTKLPPPPRAHQQ